MEKTLDAIPLWLLFAGTAALLVAGNYLGYRLGLWRHSMQAEADKGPSSAIMGSTLGLLAFILAFTFSMSSSRFDTRRNLVLDEASAILTTYQRAQLLPEPHRAQCSELLREYIDLRVRIPAMQSTEELRAAIGRSVQIQDALWAEASQMSAEPNAILSGFVQSLTQLSDLQSRRIRAALWNRIPTAIETMLYLLAFLGLMTMGYNAGLANTRPTLPTLLIVLAFAAVMILIIDLERPHQTFFHVSHEPMEAVQQRIAAPPSMP